MLTYNMVILTVPPQGMHEGKVYERWLDSAENFFCNSRVAPSLLLLIMHCSSEFAVKFPHAWSHTNEYT